MTYDVAIIGGGPASSTFARLLAEGKKDKLLLINGQSERNKKPCGGLLAPDAQKALAHFDLTLPKAVLADPQIFAVKTIDLCSRQVRYYQRHYLNMDRFAFDSWLLSLLPGNVDVISARCTGVARTEDGFEVRAVADGKETVYTCKNIVGGDGAHSIVRRAFFSDNIMQYAAIQQWFINTGESTPFYSCIFDPETSESCSWLMHKDEYVIFGGCFEKRGCKAAFERQKARLEEYLGHGLGAPVKTEACLASRPKRSGDFITGSNGAYLIGEAAGFISASSFEGISSAITSGSLLAEAFLSGKDTAKAYRSKTFSLRVKLYLKTIKRWFMYTPWARRLIMKLGIDSISLWPEK